MAKKIKVKIDNQHVFNSLIDACKFLKKNNPAGLAHAVKRGNSTYDGHTIEQLKTEVTKKVKKTDKVSCPVFCATLNKKFKTITEAAKFAKVDGWTMSLKMSKAGKFIDSEGNTYERLKPMKTKNNYRDTGSTIQKHVEFRNRPNRCVNSNIIPEVVVKPEPINIVKQDTSFNAKSFLQDKLISCIKADNLTEAKAYIQVIESLK